VPWEIYLECRSLTRFAVNADETGVLLYDAVNRGQAKAAFDLRRNRLQMRPECRSIFFKNLQFVSLGFTGLKELIAMRVVDILIVFDNVPTEKLFNQSSTINARG